MQGIKLYYKVGEAVLLFQWVVDSSGLGASFETQVGLVVEKMNTVQLSKQIVSTDSTKIENSYRTTYSPRIYKHSLTFSKRAFKSWDRQYRDYLSKNKTPKSGRWHKYYVVMVGDTKTIYMYKDLKKMHNQ